MLAPRDFGDEPRCATEEELVTSFVEEQLGKAGFNPFQAAALADAGADWHVAVRMVGEGCDHETIIDILT